MSQKRRSRSGARLGGASSALTARLLQPTLVRVQQPRLGGPRVLAVLRAALPVRLLPYVRVNADCKSDHDAQAGPDRHVHGERPVDGPGEHDAVSDHAGGMEVAREAPAPLVGAVVQFHCFSVQLSVVIACPCCALQCKSNLI